MVDENCCPQFFGATSKLPKLGQKMILLQADVAWVVPTAMRTLQ